MLEKTYYRTDDHPYPGRRGEQRVSESKVLGWIVSLFALGLAGVYLWRLMEDGQPPLSWKPFAALEAGAVLLALLLFTAPGDAIDLLLDRIRERGGDGG